MLGSLLKTSARSTIARTVASRSVYASRLASGSMTASIWNTRRYYSVNDLSKESPAFTHSASPKVKYTEDHEWIAVHDDGLSFVGITKYAADALGDATYIELPQVGDEISKGDSIGSVESVKSASELYSPVSGTVVEVNEALTDSPGLVNEDPLGKAWFAKVQVNDTTEADELMDIAAYEEFIKSD